jgi:hypothetical protein
LLDLSKPGELHSYIDLPELDMSQLTTETVGDE